MRNIAKKLLLVAMILALLGCFATAASATDLSDPDQALGYVDDYAGNVGTDPDFEANIHAAIETLRESISSYATIWSLLPPVIAIALALITKNVFLSLFIGIMTGSFVLNGFAPLASINAGLYSIVDSMSQGNTIIIASCLIVGAVIHLMEKAGGIDRTKPVLLGYSGLSDAAVVKFIEDTQDIWGQGLDPIRYTSLGSVIGTHVGPGAVAIAFFSN